MHECAALITKYAWTGRTIEYHRRQLRDRYCASVRVCRSSCAKDAGHRTAARPRPGEGPLCYSAAEPIRDSSVKAQRAVAESGMPARTSAPNQAQSSVDPPTSTT